MSPGGLGVEVMESETLARGDAEHAVESGLGKGVVDSPCSYTLTGLRAGLLCSSVGGNELHVTKGLGPAVKTGTLYPTLLNPPICAHYDFGGKPSS